MSFFVKKFGFSVMKQEEGNMNLKLCNAREYDEDDGIYRRGFVRDLLNWICGWGFHVRK